MRFEDYQRNAMETNLLKEQGQDARQVAVFGLGGEAGSVLTLYKKRLRDGEQFLGFREKMLEELGDVLWYLTALASLEGISLEEIAKRNLAKTHSRWSPMGQDWVELDDPFPPEERFPKVFEAEFVDAREEDRSRVAVYVNGEKCGATLNDNSYQPDGYRFHDIFHLTCACQLGWSPVFRALLGKKRKSDSQVDEVEDGGRAIVSDEAVAAVVFNYAVDHSRFEKIKHLDWQLLDLCKLLTQHLEVSCRSTHDWERTIFKTFELWRLVEANNGGRIRFDLTNRTAEFLG